jgi:hypothetical protein
MNLMTMNLNCRAQVDFS